MTQHLNSSTIDQIAERLKEPSWITKLRRQALAKHKELPWPHSGDDVWRRTDVSLLDPSRDFAPVEPESFKDTSAANEMSAKFAQPLSDEKLLVRANGEWVAKSTPDDLIAEELARSAKESPKAIKPIFEQNGITEAEEKLSSLNTAFHNDDVFVQVPSNYSSSQPLRLVHLFSVSAKQALFPMMLIRVSAGASVTLIDEYVSADIGKSPEAHLINGRIELILEPEAKLQYVRLQRWAPMAREFLLARATLAKGAALDCANLNLGAALSKAHIITRLVGENASSRLYGFVFGGRKQHLDQHTLQDHKASRTSSDLQFRAALQGESRMVYTGLIRIAKEAQQSEAYQSSRNLLLSRHTRAEAIPMLEILADDVRCKHAAATAPIDEEQAFYLMSRGIKRDAAQRLIVMGFAEPIIAQVPFSPLQQQLRNEIEGSLHSWDAREDG